MPSNMSLSIYQCLTTVVRYVLQKSQLICFVSLLLCQPFVLTYWRRVTHIFVSDPPLVQITACRLVGVKQTTAKFNQKCIFPGIWCITQHDFCPLWPYCQCEQGGPLHITFAGLTLLINSNIWLLTMLINHYERHNVASHKFLQYSPIFFNIHVYIYTYIQNGDGPENVRLFADGIALFMTHKFNTAFIWHQNKV